MSLFGWWKKREEEDKDDLERMVLSASEVHGVPPREIVGTVFDDEDDEDEAYLDAELEEKKSKKGLWATLVVIGMVFGLGIVGLMKLASLTDKAGPSSSTAVAQAQANLAPPTPAQLPAMTGHEVSFSAPGVFNSFRELSPTASMTDRFDIGSTGDYRRLIVVTVDASTPKYTADSNYEVRAEDPTDYSPTNAEVAYMKEPAVVMVKSDGTERTIFWEHDDNMVIVSVTDTNPRDSIPDYVTTILSTLRWIG
jgi:hypothetical protein